jgi:hypothetical protein
VTGRPRCASSSEPVGRFFSWSVFPFLKAHPLLRGLAHGVVLARGTQSLARVSGRRGEQAGSRAGAAAAEAEGVGRVGRGRAAGPGGGGGLGGWCGRLAQPVVVGR